MPAAARKRKPTRENVRTEQETADVLRIGPQPGPQETFLATPADIAIYGGSAGGGKSWGLLFEGLRHTSNPDFGYVIFRRTSTQIRNEGGLWDESMRLYPLAGATPRPSTLDWFFPSGAWVGFAHLEHEKTVLDHHGAQYAAIGFDELTHFTEYQFFYLLSRNRSSSGVAGYIRATCNPDPDSWVAEFIAWWIDQRETIPDENGVERTNPTYGLAIPERAGVLRWFVRINDEICWADSAEELRERFAHLPPESVLPKSVTFIPAKLTDNPILMRQDPGYLASLLAMPLVERERLLGGNWKIRAGRGKVFPRAAWRIINAVPKGKIRWVRYWDKAGTEYEDGPQDKKDWTVGLKMGYHLEREEWIIADVVRGQWEAAERNQVMRQTAELDGPSVAIWVEWEPGSGGKESAFASVRMLRGYSVHLDRVTVNKLGRADPLAAQQQVGNVSLLRGPWIPAFLAETEAFPTRGIPDDQVDAASGAFNRMDETPDLGEAADWNTVQQ